MTAGKVIIVHGSYGNPQENWFPWLASQLQNAGCETAVPAFPTPTNQSLESWQAALSAQVEDIDGRVVLVGHSLGCAFVLRLIEKADEPVRGAYLVSGFLGVLGQPEFDTVNDSFFKDPFNWDKVREKVGVARVYNGSDDPYVPLSKGVELAHLLGTKLTIVEGGGHINAAAGFRTFPRLLDDILQTLS